MDEEFSIIWEGYEYLRDVVAHGFTGHFSFVLPALKHAR
jgi:hypothetical protein